MAKSNRKLKRRLTKASQLREGQPTGERIARGEGTAGMLGALGRSMSSGDATRNDAPQAVGQHVFHGCLMIDCDIQSTNAQIHGGVVKGKLHAMSGSHIVLDCGTVVDENTPVTIDINSIVEARDAFLGDRFVENVELTAHHQSGITSTQISSRAGAVFSAQGEVPTTEHVHARVGAILVRHFHERHIAILEKRGECGAKLRDGTNDAQVDVFLRALSDDSRDDIKVQVVIVPAVAEHLGEDGIAIDFVFDEQAIRAALDHKEKVDGKGRLDLVISLPLQIGSPTRKALELAATHGKFDTGGYAHLWLVDAAEWLLLLGSHLTTGSARNG